MNVDFVHLNVHSSYSLLRGFGRIGEIVNRAKGLGFDTLALTDTNGLYGAVEFFLKAHAAGIKPILGAEIMHEGDRAVCLVRDRVGYSNLCRLVSARRLAEDFSLSRALIAHQEGLFFLVRDEALLVRLCGEVEAGRLFREVWPFGGADADVVPGVRKIPPVATNNVHFITPEGYGVHRILTAIRMNKLVTQVPSSALAPGDAWLRSGEEMARLFAGGLGGRALANTRRIAEECRLELQLGTPVFPRFFNLKDVQKRFAGETPYSALCRVAFRGARERYRSMASAVMKRLARELEVINRLGFCEYFLIVWDIVNFARRRKISLVGRGSAANSLVAYTLGISSVDPLYHNLYFERFLNLSRSDCPDIDLDIAWRRRDEVLAYVYERYGNECVAMVSNHNTYRAWSAFRDVARVMGVPVEQINRLAGQLPEYSSGSIREAIALYPEARDFPLGEAPYRTIVALAETLDGIPRHVSVHNGGIVIGERSLTDLVPLERSAKGLVVTQYEMRAVEAVGLVKIDLLGHRTLSVLGDTVAAIAGNGGVKLDLAKIADGDRKTAETLRTGRTIGCFQIESPGMRSLLQMIRAGNRRDVIHALSLIRPGPSASGMKERFVRRRLGEEATEYDDPRLEAVLQETYGVMLFQEDILKVAQVIAGFSLEAGDGLRKAISKQRSPERMAALQRQFITGALARGTARPVAQRIWQLINNFAGYSYCKAHAVTYGYISYQTAWLKTHYPAEFLAAVMTNGGGFYEVREYLEEARRWGVRVLPPEVNAGAVEHSGHAMTLRIGLGQVKGLSQRALRSILRARAARPFAGLEDFYYRTQVNDAETESLILCGAMGGFGQTRPELLWRHRLLSRAIRKSFDESLGGMFPGLAEAAAPAGRPAPRLPEYSEEKRIGFEQEILGLAVTDHPLRIFERELCERRLVRSSHLGRHVGRRVTVVGWLVAMRRAVTTRCKTMKFVTLEDRFGTMEVTLFPETYCRFGDRLRTYGPYLVRGRVEQHHRALGITAEWVDVVQGGGGVH